MGILKRLHCPHVHLRAIFGDEIHLSPGYRRIQCKDCGAFLDGPVKIAEDRQFYQDIQESL